MLRHLPILAAAFALLFNFTSALRPVASEDLGYHLAYGDSALRGEGIVCDARWIHPAPTPAEAKDPPLPPGAWFDEQGKYHFINANWLSQVIFSLVYRISGGVGLSLLGAALVSASMVFLGLAMRRMNLSWTAVALAWLLCSIASYERYTLRPELFSYALFAAMLWVLVGKMTWRTVITLGVLQLLAVNLHSYWILNFALIGAVITEKVVLGCRLFVFMRFKKIQEQHRQSTELGSEIVRFYRDSTILGVALLIMSSVSLLNPWGLAGAIMPAQTAQYLIDRHIAGSGFEQAAHRWDSGQAHPWELIQEFQFTFDPMGRRLSSISAEYLIFAALIALLIFLLRQSFAWLILTTAAILIGISMRRNIAPAMLMIAPGLLLTIEPLMRRFPAALRSGGSAAILAVSVFLAGSVVSGAWYSTLASYPQTFGVGLDSRSMRLELVKFLDENLAKPQAAFVSSNISSNVLYFSRKIASVTVLSNTWATPPRRMADHLRMTNSQLDLEPGLTQASIDLVALDYTTLSINLIRKMAAEPEWAPVWLDRSTAVFARRTPENAEMIRRTAGKMSLEKLSQPVQP